MAGYTRHCTFEGSSDGGAFDPLIFVRRSAVANLLEQPQAD